MKIIFTTFVTICFALHGLSQNIQYTNNALRLYSDNINSGDARYIGMGGAMGALGGNVNATNQNPAGLAVSISSDINFTLGLSNYENQSNFGSNRTADDSQFNFQQVGANLVLPGANDDWKSFSLGFNYVSEELDNEILLGRNENVRFQDASDPNDVQNFTFNGFGDFMNGVRQKLSVSFASNYQDKIYLGAGLNFHNVDFSNNIAYSETNDTQGFTTVYEQRNAPYSEIGDGFSFSLGAIAKLNQNLRLGAAYHSPIWYNFIEESFVAVDDNGTLDDADNQFFNAISDYELTTGGRFVGSAGLVFGKNLALNFDYTYHMNQGLRLRPNGAFDMENQFIDDFVNNSSEFRIGGEYRYNQLRFRAGYNFVESPYDDLNGVAVRDQNNAVQNQVSNALIGDIQRYSAGIGYDFGSFYLDFAYQNQTQDYNYIFGGAQFTTNNAELLDLDPYSANVERTQNLFLLTAGWKF